MLEITRRYRRNDKLEKSFSKINGVLICGYVHCMFTVTMTTYYNMNVTWSASALHVCSDYDNFIIIIIKKMSAV